MKRVPMDFDWPLGRVWKGFLNPYEGCDCPWCYDEGRRSSYGVCDINEWGCYGSDPACDDFEEKEED